MARLLVRKCAFALLCVCVRASGPYSEFPVFPRRTVHVLDGTWQFAWLGSNVSDVTVITPNGVQTSLFTVVPSSFDLLPYPGRTNNLVGQRGTVLFRTTVYTTPNTLARLRFGACGFYCTVWVDGVQVGEHGGNGYTGFWVGGIPPSFAAMRTLEIVADNRFNYTTAILHGYVDDWYQYGGLYRSVEWHELGPAAPSTVAVQNVDVIIRNANLGMVDARIRLHDATETTKLALIVQPGQAARFHAPRYRGNGGDALLSSTALPTFINVSIWWDNDSSSPVSYSNVNIDQHGIGSVTGLVVPNATLWDVTSPVMHTLHMSVTGSNNGPALDYIIERFGLRTFVPCTQGTSNGTATLCLNGQPIKLKGYGRHDTSPSLGHALGYMARLNDYLLMQGLGSNFVRIGHYTQDRSFSTLADTLGLLAWTEIIGWDSEPSTYKDPNWIAASIAAIEEHVNDTFNHPSAVMMAYINEGTSDDPTVCSTYATLNAKYKSMEINALTGYATDKGSQDKCIEPSGADYIGFNLYPGWYETVDASGGPGTGNIPGDIQGNVALVQTAMDTVATWMGTVHPRVPFFVSELGAGAIPGWVDQMNGVWTEAYAGRIVSAGASVAVHDDRWSGIAIWQLMDQRVYTIGEGVLGRPRGFNNKGTFDENRKAKLPLYSAVYNAFHGLPEPDWMQAVYP